MTVQLAGCSSSDGAELQTQVPDTLKRSAFIDLTKQYLVEMKAHRTMSTDECITMVRLYNTIGYCFSDSSDATLKSFMDVYWNNYLQQCVSQLNAKLSKGMGFYSKEHNLYIGGPDDIGSRFVVL